MESAAKRRKLDQPSTIGQTQLDPIAIKISTPVNILPMGKSTARCTAAMASFASGPLCTDTNWLAIFDETNYWILDGIIFHPEAFRELLKAARSRVGTVEGIFFEKCNLDAACAEVLVTEGNPLGSKIKIKLEECKISASAQLKGVAPSIHFQPNCTWSVGPSSSIAASKHD